MDEILRREVRLLTTRLGSIARELAGEETFRAIENLRGFSKQLRQNPSPELLSSNQQEVQRLSLRRATEVAHAFSLFFHLVNLCEERQRVRRLRAYEDHEKGAPMSLRHTFSEFSRHKVAAREILNLLRTMHVEPVLTAHPTEAKRRSVFNHVLRIGRSLEALGGSAEHSVEKSVDPWVEALWLTEETRERPMTPELEVENSLVFLERTIYDLAGISWERFVQEMSRYAPRLAGERRQRRPRDEDVGRGREPPHRQQGDDRRRDRRGRRRDDTDPRHGPARPAARRRDRPLDPGPQAGRRRADRRDRRAPARRGRSRPR